MCCWACIVGFRRVRKHFSIAWLKGIHNYVYYIAYLQIEYLLYGIWCAVYTYVHCSQ